MYSIVNTNGTKLDLSQPIMLQKCSSHRLSCTGSSCDDKSFIIRLMGEVVMRSDGGYVASFGPHDSPFSCGHPTWLSAAHQAAGHPPYSEWCDISVKVDITR